MNLSNLIKLFIHFSKQAFRLLIFGLFTKSSEGQGRHSAYHRSIRVWVFLQCGFILKSMEPYDSMYRICEGSYEQLQSDLRNPYNTIYY